MTNISEFDYELPPERIAQHPLYPREQAKLMVLPTNSKTIIHDHVGNLASYLRKGDIVVINNTKVFNARLAATIQTVTHSSKKVELFLIKPVVSNDKTSSWQCIGKPGKALKVGTTITIAQDFNGTITEKCTDGTFNVTFDYSVNDVITKANNYGSIPLPPYIKTTPRPDDYQTVYAKKVGSVAAPTAGFHITDNIITQMKAKGVHIVEITLHVGLGTFLPIKSETIEDHTMHSEWVEISQEASDSINLAKHEKRRVIAIGTTTLRALEGSLRTNIASSISAPGADEATAPGAEELKPYKGEVNVFITPGFSFRIVDCLLTNFHLPKSTLLLLVSAFAGKERIKEAYQEAIGNKYRFFSFGDAMFIVNQIK